MSIPHCQRITAHVSQIASESEFSQEMRALAARAYTSAEVTDLLCAHLPFEVARELRAEYAELPAIMADLIVNSWRLADESGKAWTFESVAPSEPIAFARKGKVRFSVDVDESGVTLGVAHVAGHKAAWYQPAAQPAAARG